MVWFWLFAGEFARRKLGTPRALEVHGYCLVGKMIFQSSFMLMTVHFFSLAAASSASLATSSHRRTRAQVGGEKHDLRTSHSQVFVFPVVIDLCFSGHLF
jgi:hypothetical protein